MKTSIPILLLSFCIILILLILTSTANTTDQSSDISVSEDEINDFLEAVYDEISTYLSIDKILGKYQTVNSSRSLNQIAIQLHSTFPKDIDLSDLLIELSDGYQTYYYHNSQYYNSFIGQSLFSHTIWQNITPHTFGILVLCDKDQSIIQHGVVNHHSDRIMILLQINDTFSLKNGDHLIVSLHPSPGIIRSLELEIPFSTRPIVRIS